MFFCTIFDASPILLSETSPIALPGIFRYLPLNLRSYILFFVYFAENNSERFFNSIELSWLMPFPFQFQMHNRISTLYAFSCYNFSISLFSLLPFSISENYSSRYYPRVFAPVWTILLTALFVHIFEEISLNDERAGQIERVPGLNPISRSL